MKREDNMTKNIETERLILRCFLPEDALQIHPLFCDDEAMRLVGMYPAFTKLKQMGGKSPPSGDCIKEQ